MKHAIFAVVALLTPMVAAGWNNQDDQQNDQQRDRRALYGDDGTVMYPAGRNTYIDQNGNIYPQNGRFIVSPQGRNCYLSGNVYHCD